MKISPLPAEEGGGFQAIVPQFGRGVVGYGETQEQAAKDLSCVLPSYLAALKETGQEVPPPEPARLIDDFSGKFNIRVPKLLHAQLADLSDENGVSLNQMVTMLLTSGVTAARAWCSTGKCPQEPAKRARG